MKTLARFASSLGNQPRRESQGVAAIPAAIIGGTCGIACLLLLAGGASAQLSITEVMSRAATTHGTNFVTPGPDYWELSNFGTNAIDLTGYRFNDSDGGLLGADSSPFNDLTIQGHESIVFFESVSNLVSPESFRDWWGLGSSVRVIPYIYPGFGFSSSTFGDGVRLWGPNATDDKDVVDSVDFGAATRGRSFTYNHTNGEFGILSSSNVPNAFKAVTADDWGSPGKNSGPVRLSFATEPTNLVVNPGDTATFKVKFRGLPRPTLQWLRNGVAIAGARFPSYTVESVQPEDAGTYEVILSNIFEVVTSKPATLTLNTNPVPPTFLSPPTELRVFVDQEAIFRAVATGLPQPSYQWYKDGLIIPGETNRTLVIPAGQSVGTNFYSVTVANALGSVSRQAPLIVTERPDLRVTELMCSERDAPGLDHKDWWELTNFGTDAVDLFGYRFDDFSDVIGRAQGPHLEFAWIIKDHIVIRPRESVVFVESIPVNAFMTANVFRRWWGWTNLPPNLQIVTYSGSGLGFSGDRADGLALWNMGATREEDVVNKYTLVSYSESAISNGVSFAVIPDSLDPAESICCEILSEVGVNGAFVAAESGDIGSPGYIQYPTEPRILTISVSTTGCQLTWRSVLPGLYLLQYRERLGEGNWQDLATLPATGLTSSYIDTNARGIPQRFYRVIPAP